MENDNIKLQAVLLSLKQIFLQQKKFCSFIFKNIYLQLPLSTLKNVVCFFFNISTNCNINLSLSSTGRNNQMYASKATFHENKRSYLALFLSFSLSLYLNFGTSRDHRFSQRRQELLTIKYSLHKQ